MEKIEKTENENSLERYLARKPLSDRHQKLMEEGDDDLDEIHLKESDEIEPVAIARASVVTDDDRDHLRRLLLEPGWQVLLKLLDRDVSQKEDAAKRMSMDNPLGGDHAAIWGEVSYLKRSRSRIVTLAQEEAKKLKAKKTWPGSGQTKTQAETN